MDLDLGDEAFEFKPAELAMADQLADAMTADYDPERFHDEYREALMAVIEAKVAGQQVVEGWHGQPWGKPLVKTREYVEIVRAALRRGEPSTEPVVEVGELRVDLEKRAVSVAGRSVQLTPHEFALLRVLARNPGKLLTHATLLREVWGRGFAEESHYLHVYVSQLRRKLEPDPARPRYLVTEPGVGYRLVDPAREAS